MLRQLSSGSTTSVGLCQWQCHAQYAIRRQSSLAACLTGIPSLDIQVPLATSAPQYPLNNPSIPPQYPPPGSRSENPLPMESNSREIGVRACIATPALHKPTLARYFHPTNLLSFPLNSPLSPLPIPLPFPFSFPFPFPLLVPPLSVLFVNATCRTSLSR